VLNYISPFNPLNQRRTRAVAVLEPQASPLITPDVASSAFTAMQPSVQLLASDTPLEVSSPSPSGGVNDHKTTVDKHCNRSFRKCEGQRCNDDRPWERAGDVIHRRHSEVVCDVQNHRFCDVQNHRDQKRRQAARGVEPAWASILRG
jgi:hypothetical protein